MPGEERLLTGKVARALAVLACAFAGAASLWADVNGPEATPLYGACITTAECIRSADACVHGQVSSGGIDTAYGICTETCAVDSDCPDNGICIEISAGQLVCAGRCTVTSECGDEQLRCNASACVPLDQ